MLFRLILFLIFVMFTASNTNAQSAQVTAKAGAEIIHLIRREKLDIVLPGAMRDNNVDMLDSRHPRWGPRPNGFTFWTNIRLYRIYR